MAKLSPYTEAKLIYGKYIKESPNLPDHMKSLAKQHVFSILNTIPEYLGHLELLWRRENFPSNQATKRDR